MASTQGRFSQSAKPSAIWREKKKKATDLLYLAVVFYQYTQPASTTACQRFITCALQTTYVKWTHFWHIESHSFSSEHHDPPPPTMLSGHCISHVFNILVWLFPRSISPLSKPSWLVWFILLWTAVAAAADHQANTRPWSCTKAKSWHSN